LFLGPLGRNVSRFATWLGRNWMPVHPRDVSPERAITEIAPRPVLLFHGGRDLLTPFVHSERLLAAAGSPKSLHRLPRSWHTSIHPSERSAYARTLLEFFMSCFDLAG
jgi:alpha-beta hydrolase superfamily lysophospholipase